MRKGSSDGVCVVAFEEALQVCKNEVVQHPMLEHFKSRNRRKLQQGMIGPACKFIDSDQARVRSQRTVSY